MADSTREREKQRSDDERRDGDGGGGEKRERDGDGAPRKKRRRSSAGRAAAAARREISELMGREPEAVSGVERDDDEEGGWIVTVEFVELERIPQSTDVMATYEVTLDGDGELAGYRRTKRYVRSQAEG